jgi:hypothetical protein
MVIGGASFGVTTGSQGCGVRAGVPGIDCAAVAISDVGGSWISGRGGSGTGGDCMSIVYASLIFPWSVSRGEPRIRLGRRRWQWLGNV